MTEEAKRAENTETTPAPSSRLGREAKIGVTVILLLLLVLAGVIVLRLTGSRSDDNVATANEGGNAAEKAASPATPTATPKDPQSTLFGSAAPTVVAAKSAPASPPKTTISDADQWKLPADRESKQSAGTGPSLGSPPSFMPEPPKPEPAERHEQQVLNVPTEKEPPKQASKPPADKRAANASPLRPTDKDVPLVTPGETKLTSSEKPSDSHGDAMGSTPADPAPEHRTPPPEPVALSSGPSYSAQAERSTPARAAPQFAADDYRREPPTGFQSSGGPSRRSSGSTANPSAGKGDDGKY